MILYGTINEKGKIVINKKGSSEFKKQSKIKESVINKIVEHFVIEEDLYNTLIKVELSKEKHLYIFVDREKKDIFVSDKEDERVMSLQTAYETQNFSTDDVPELIKEDKKKLYLMVGSVVFLLVVFGMLILTGEEEEPVKPIITNTPTSSNVNTQPVLTEEDYEKMRISATNQIMGKITELVNTEFKEHKGIPSIIKLSVNPQGVGEGEIMFYYEIPTVGSELDEGRMLYRKVERFNVTGDKNIKYGPIFNYDKCVRDLLKTGFVVYKITDRSINLKLDSEDIDINNFIRVYNNCMFIINSLEVSDNGKPNIDVEVTYALQKKE